MLFFGVAGGKLSVSTFGALSIKMTLLKILSMKLILLPNLYSKK